MSVSIPTVPTATDWVLVAPSPDAELPAPIRLPARMFRPGPIVAAEVRRVHHFDRKLVCSRQREETPRNVEHVADQLFLDSVTDQVEEADAVGGGSQSH